MIKKILIIGLLLSIMTVLNACAVLDKIKPEIPVMATVPESTEEEEPEPAHTNPRLREFLSGSAKTVIDSYVFSNKGQELGCSYLTYSFTKGSDEYTIDELMNAMAVYEKNENSIGKGGSDQIEVEVSYEYADLDGDLNNELIILGTHENENHKSGEMIIVCVKNDKLHVAYAMNTYDSAFGNGEYHIDRYGLEYVDEDIDTVYKQYCFDQQFRPKYIGYYAQNRESGISRYAIAENDEVTMSSIELCRDAFDEYAESIGCRLLRVEGPSKFKTYCVNTKGENPEYDGTNPETAEFRSGKWYEDTAGWYWLNSDFSSPCNTWQWCDGNKDGQAECYYFDAYGYCYFDSNTPDGRTVDATGALTVDGVPQIREVEVIEETMAAGSKEY